MADSNDKFCVVCNVKIKPDWSNNPKQLCQKTYCAQELPINRCVICKVDIGATNPRQLCRKTFCANNT